MALPDKDAGWRRECLLSDSDTIDIPQSCVDRKRPLIAIWGDSTAAALIPGFQKLQETFEFGIAQFTVSSCPPLMVRVARMTSSCLKRNEQIATLIEAQSPDIVVLQAYWSSTDTLETIRPTIDALRANKIVNIFILGSVPVWHGGLPGAVASFYRLNGSVIPPRVQQYVDPSVGESSMLEIANRLGVKYISARNALCNGDGCLTRVGNSLTASDTIHLTTAGSELLVETIAPKLGFTLATSSPKPN
jgi:SGNH domain (fused to AT3 domains)